MKAKMIADLRRDFPIVILVGVMAVVMQARRRRAWQSKDFRIENAERVLEQFLQDCTPRQLQLVREMAKGAELAPEWLH
jgi:hypothetical protein